MIKHPENAMKGGRQRWIETMNNVRIKHPSSSRARAQASGI